MNKYFRFMETPEEDWGMYRHAFVYGADGRLNFRSNDSALSAPEVWDYLVLGENRDVSFLCPTSFEKYNAVFYSNIPPLEQLLDDGVLVEVPEDIRELDWLLQAKIDALGEAIDVLEDRLEKLKPKMNERRFMFLTQEARDSQQVYNELKQMLDGMHRELDGVYQEMSEKVEKPLMERVQARKERNQATVDDLIFGASSRGNVVLGMKKEFEVEREF